MSDRLCDGEGRLPCACPSMVHQTRPCSCGDLACPGCPACEDHRKRLEAEQAAKDRETADWYHSFAGSAPPKESKGKGKAAKGTGQPRLFE